MQEKLGIGVRKGSSIPAAWQAEPTRRNRAEGDMEALELVEQLTPEHVTMEHIMARNTLMEKYGYDTWFIGVGFRRIF